LQLKLPIFLSKKLSWSLSTRPKKDLHVEISAVKHCSIRCTYCPQDQLLKSSSNEKNSFNLTLDKFKEYLNNLPKEYLTIYWTGYAEPCLNKHLPEMVEYAYNLGINQAISTTLVGHNHCIDFLSRTNAFNKEFMLHLPDNDGNMETGALRVNEKYLSKLRTVISSFDNGKSSKLATMCLGNKYHKSIETLIRSMGKSYLIKCCDENFYTRAGDIDLKDFKSYSSLNLYSIINTIKKRPLNSLKKLKYIFKKNILIKIKNSIDIKTNTYFCSFKRLNQPVVLGDGKMNICCQDYNLSCIVGDLNNNNYDDIYKDWFSKNSLDFVGGKLKPCTSCEFYKPLTLGQILLFGLRYIFDTSKNILKIQYINKLSLE